MLKLPGTQRLTQKCDKLLSNSAFNINSRRYTKGIFTLSVSAATSGMYNLAGM
jgi:hypothetical protein